VHGIVGGSPLLQKTVLPATAEANLSIRLAPGQDVDEIHAALERLLRDAAPDGAELEVTKLAANPPGLVPPEEPAVQLALGAFDRAFGRRPLLTRSGGTLPIIPALAGKGIPTILSGFALPESNIHSPNERILAEYVPLGIEVARTLFQSLARLE
jgi:acetylornithine deacetylase/succinyl-diaminopimelate desuccinylase-like protein